MGAVLVGRRCSGVAVTLPGCPEETTEPPADGGSEGGACKLEYVGNTDAAIELEVVALDPDYVAQPFVEGGDLSILYPPQGGRVVFVGVRAKNLDPCAVRLTGVLRDPASMQVRVDTRTVNLDPTADGWGESDAGDISTFSNIPVCPNSWAETDVFDQTFTMEVHVKDRTGKEADAIFNAVPRCNEAKVVDGLDLQKDCLCICKQGYITGEMCQ
ncbi:MAG: hypothetical protein R3B70_26295 [Polyangiaceae bacterium]